MSANSGWKAKMANFQERFKSMLGAKAQGYDELNTLERPLVSDVHEQEEYERQHGVGPAAAYSSEGGYRPPPTSGGGAYHPPLAGAGGYPPAPPAAVGRVSQGPMPSQADELQELSLLARDAAEILWEMVAMGEIGAAVEDMKSKGQQLQAQLRGLIGDYQGGDENIFAKAFESFDMLSRCLEEVSAPQQPEQAPPAALAAPPAAVATPAAPPAVSRPADEPPLISFD